MAAAEWQRREKVFGQAEAAVMATALDRVEVIVNWSFSRHKVESKLGLYLGESSNVNVLIYSRFFCTIHSSQFSHSGSFSFLDSAGLAISLALFLISSIDSSFLTLSGSRVSIFLFLGCMESGVNTSSNYFVLKVNSFELHLNSFQL